MTTRKQTEPWAERAGNGEAPSLRSFDRLRMPKDRGPRRRLLRFSKHRWRWVNVVVLVPGLDELSDDPSPGLAGATCDDDVFQISHFDTL